MGTSKVKKFDKLLFEIKREQGGLIGIWVMWIALVGIFFVFSPAVEFGMNGFYVQGIFFRGIFVLFSTYSYMKSYVCIKESGNDISIYKKLKYCPISKKDIIIMRFIYLVRYTFMISIILIIVNCISCMQCYRYIKIGSIIYPVFLVLFFGFLPISFALILEVIRAIVLKNKKIGYLVKIVFFIIIFKYIIFLWGICFNQYIHFSKAGITITRNIFNDNEEAYRGFFIPDIDDLPKYEDILYQNHETTLLFFISIANNLVVEYDDEIYYREKANLEKEYVFLENKNTLP